jgi:predicted HNH restriction endonuclease
MKKTIKKEEKKVEEKVEEKKEESTQDEMMSTKKIENLIYEFSKTEFWLAVRDFLDIQFIKTRDSLMTFDPNNSSGISYKQGQLGGIILLKTYVNKLKEAKNNENEDAQPDIKY